MDVFIIGINGRIGRLLAGELRDRGDTVRGLVRRGRDGTDLAARGVQTCIGDVGAMTPQDLAYAVHGADVIVFTAGSNGGERHVTQAIDLHGVTKAVEAGNLAGVPRFALVSVFPEAWRERELPEDEEYYFAAKKEAEVVLTHSDLDWLILRPALLTDGPVTGRVSIGPAERHGQISRHDVAVALALLLHEPRISRQILELNEGSTPTKSAIARCVRSPAA
ncbi:NAD(P)H-binding protein [Dactylosporangium sp. CA-233914]|uniref:NAD(P)H-binding protein n=1 Tax=Dactylosporangium sp. CA-233914 TaxID=3239934 RepID=UPI003D934AD2